VHKKNEILENVELSSTSSSNGYT